MPSINESNDFQQGGCLYKLTDGIQWTSEHLWMSDMPQRKQTSQLLTVVFWQLVSLLMELSIGNETILCHCVHNWQVLANLVTNII